MAKSVTYGVAVNENLLFYVFSNVYPFEFVECKNDNKEKIVEEKKLERNCQCPFDEIIDEKIIRDSSFIKNNEDDIFDWSLNGSISSKISKYIDLEINGESESSKNYNISTKNIVTKIKNNYPDLNKEQYNFKTGKLFFCSYYNLLCRDSTISQVKLTAMSLKKT